MHVTISVPAAWLSGFDIAEHEEADKDVVERAVKDALLRVLGTALPENAAELLARETPVSANQGTVVRMTLSLPGAESSVLAGFALQQGITPGPMAKRLLALLASGELPSGKAQRPEVPVPADHPLELLNQKRGRPARSEQVALYDAIWESLSGSRVGLVEGGTGIGKTLAMVAAAGRWAREKQQNAAICVPTIALLRQFAREYESQSQTMDMPALRTIVGRREYVSEDELRAFLAGRGKAWDSEVVQDWLARGYLDGGADTAWQVHDLERIAPGIPLDEVRLGDYASQSDRGYVAYKAQFARTTSQSGAIEAEAMPPSILVFTHAMLAQDMRRKLQISGQDEDYKLIRAAYFETLRGLKGSRMKNQSDRDEVAELQRQLGVAMLDAVEDGSILPWFSALLVDEGHLLEESFSNAMSDYVSIRGLVADLRSFRAEGGKLDAGALDAADACVKDLMAYSADVDRSEYVALNRTGMTSAVAALARLAAICELVGGVRDKNSTRFKLSVKLRRAGALLSLAVSKASARSYVRYSPVRAFPQLYIGRNSADDLLFHLWSSVQGAAVISATLYLQTNAGASGRFMAGLLCIPDFKAAYFAPVHPRWSTACVNGVWLPQAQPDWLVPPSMRPGPGRRPTQEEFAVREALWHEDVARAVHRIQKDAEGGVMVLCTSYATVAAVATLLRLSAPEIAGHMVVAGKNDPLRNQVQRFLQARQTGAKALWLAVGAAWTGVDVGGHDPWAAQFGEILPAEQDNVLTDLVIPRLPFGTNQSLTHLWRVQHRPGVPWDLLDASFRFKQALGRLVRRAGLPKTRRIFVLDGRLSDPLQAPRLAPFSNHLLRYSKVTFRH